MRIAANRLQPPVDVERDHILGRLDAAVTLVEYGDYQCRYCRRAQAGIKELVKERLPNQLRYVFRHFPNTKLHPQARLAAEAAEAAAEQGAFWDMHDYLFHHPGNVNRDALLRAADKFGLDTERFADELDAHSHAARVEEDIASAHLSGANGTPTFFINGHRYDGPWDPDSIVEAIQQPLGLRLRLLARAFAGLSISTGLLMIVAVVVALLWANSPWGTSYTALWETELGLSLDGLGFSLSLREWVNDGLIVIFFFVLGLEIKRELIAGELAEPRRAALPVAAALGGMIVPALIYLALNAGGPAAAGWGVPMATDTAFALGLLAMLGRRVPLPLTVFVAALAIADDVGAILVLAFFYSSDLSFTSLAVVAGLFGLALLCNRVRIYQPLPYVLVGVALWFAVLSSGMHATMAGVLLALAIPTRPPPRTPALLSQSIAAFSNLHAPVDGQRSATAYQQTVGILETVLERLLSPAQRLERNLRPWNSYLILPLFALANAGIRFAGEPAHLLQPLSLGVIAGLVLGKPLGITLGAWLAVRLRLAEPPREFSWRQLIGGGVLCGIGFTMSIFIAAAAFSDPAQLTLAKTSVMAASVLAGAVGWFVLRGARSPNEQRTPTASGAAAGGPAAPVGG